MFGFPPWIVYAASVAACIPIVLLGFKSPKSRTRAFFTLVPLPLLGLAIYQLGDRVSLQSEVVDLRASPESYTKPSTISVGSHEEGEQKQDKTLLGTLIANAGEISELNWPDKGKTYTPATLWNRIDGAAEVYKRFGLRRALFATAQFDGHDIELQLFDLGSSDNAQRYFEKVTGDTKGKSLPNVGDSAILWEGGGELLSGRVYARVVLTTGGDIPEVAQMPTQILEKLGKSAGNADAQEPQQAHDASSDAPPEPSETPKTVQNPLAEKLGIETVLIDRYAILDGALDGTSTPPVKTTTHSDPLSAAAFIGSMLVPDSKRLGQFGFVSSNKAALAKGKTAIWGEGPNAADRVKAKAQQLEAEPIAGIAALESADELEVLLSGWSGRAFLGQVIVGRWEDGTEAFVVPTPSDSTVFDKLKASFPAVEQLKGNTRFHATDPYLGDVLFGQQAQRIVGVAGYEDAGKAKALFKLLLTAK